MIRISMVGKFESSEYGKFTISSSNITKHFYIGVTNSKELEKYLHQII